MVNTCIIQNAFYNIVHIEKKEKIFELISDKENTLEMHFSQMLNN